MTQPHDLTTEKRSAGRPSFDPTEEDREKVRVLKAHGMSDEAICEVFGVSIPTLRKHCAYELEIGSAKTRADVMMARYKAAMDGSVNAQNRLIDDMADATRSRPGTKPGKIGKKEQQQVAAELVDGLYAPPTPPKLVVNNA